MRNIFIGMLLVFLDFNFDFDTSRIGLIPDFIGYIFIIKGLAEMTEKSSRFAKVRPHAIGMLIYTAILYVMDVFGASAALEVWAAFVVGLVSTIISLYISYNIVMGVGDMQRVQERQLNADGLYFMWKLLAVFSIGSIITLWIPLLNIISIIVAIIITICFLVSFNKTKNLYYS